MRVLFVSPGRDLGGAELSLLLLLQGLRTKGVEATVAVYSEGPFRNRLSSLGFSSFSLNLPRFVARATRYRLWLAPFRIVSLMAAALPTSLRLAALARRVKADLIHTDGLKAHLLGGLAGRITGIPVFWHLRDFPPSGFAGYVFRLAAQRLTTLVIANSNAVALSVRSKDGRVPHIIRVFNPVDLNRFRPGLPRGRIRRELGLGDNVPLIGLVAHLTPWKGHGLFLAIARAVADSVPDAHFVIAGGAIYETDGHAGYLKALHRRAVVLGLKDQVTFLGLREDVPEILADLDVLVHCPTAPEPFGRVLAEAMAVGRPVVAASCGGIPEVMEHGVTGFLVPVGDVKGFASAVIRLLTDPALKEKFGREGCSRAEALFGVGNHISGLLEAYQTIMVTQG